MEKKKARVSMTPSNYTGNRKKKKPEVNNVINRPRAYVVQLRRYARGKNNSSGIKGRILVKNVSLYAKTIFEENNQKMKKKKNKISGITFGDKSAGKVFPRHPVSRDQVHVRPHAHTRPDSRLLV